MAAQHPQISRAIETLSANGVPTIALISEHADKGVAGFVGTDSVMLGRTAAWALDRICQKPGKIGIILGSHRYRCHEQNEIGFRSYLREHRPDLSPLWHHAGAFAGMGAVVDPVVAPWTQSAELDARGRGGVVSHRLPHGMG